MTCCIWSDPHTYSDGRTLCRSCRFDWTEARRRMAERKAVPA